MHKVEYDRGPTPYELVERYGYDWDKELAGYPIWDEERRSWLNRRIYENFMYREIAQDTGADFFRWANVKLNQVMPVINPVAAAALGFDPDKTDFTVSAVSRTRTDAGYTDDGTSSSESAEKSTSDLTTTNDGSATNKATSVTSTTPQVQLSGEENYMDALQEDGTKSESTAKEVQAGETTGSGTASGEDHKEGTSWQETTGTQQGGSWARLEADWLDNAPDILGTVYAALESLFVQVW